MTRRRESGGEKDQRGATAAQCWRRSAADECSNRQRSMTGEARTATMRSVAEERASCVASCPLNAEQAYVAGLADGSRSWSSERPSRLRSLRASARGAIAC